jgi:hypothetical protein
MRFNLTILFLLMCSALMAQSYTYSYIEPCSGKMKTLSIPYGQNNVTVNYYGNVNTFNANDFNNGIFSNWMNSIAQMNSSQPCGEITTVLTNTINSVVTQNVVATVMNITSIAAMAQNMSSLSGSLGNGIGGSLGNSVNNSEGGGSGNSNGSGGKKGKSNGGNNNNGSNNNGSNNSSGNGSSSQGQVQGSSVTQGGSTSQPGNASGSGTNGSAGSNQSGTGGENTGTGSSTGSTGNGTVGGASTGNGTGGGASTGGGTGSGTTGGGAGSSTGGGTGTGGNTGSGATPNNSQDNTSTAKSGGSGSTANSISNAEDNSGGGNGGGKNGGSRTRTGSLIGTGDVVALRSAEDPNAKDQFKFTASLTRANTNNTRIKGALGNFTTEINNTNLTLYSAWVIPKSQWTVIAANSTMMNFERDAFNTTTLLGSKRFKGNWKKLTAMGGINYTIGKFGETKFTNLSAVGGGFYSFNAGKKISGSILCLAVYSPFTQFYDGQWWQSSTLIVPFSSWDYSITKTFKFNISFSGVYELNQKFMNYQVLTGGKIML